MMSESQINFSLNDGMDARFRQSLREYHQNMSRHSPRTHIEFHR